MLIAVTAAERVLRVDDPIDLGVIGVASLGESQIGIVVVGERISVWNGAVRRRQSIQYGQRDRVYPLNWNLVVWKLLSSGPVGVTGSRIIDVSGICRGIVRNVEIDAISTAGQARNRS